MHTHMHTHMLALTWNVSVQCSGLLGELTRGDADEDLHVVWRTRGQTRDWNDTGKRIHLWAMLSSKGNYKNAGGLTMV